MNLVTLLMLAFLLLGLFLGWGLTFVTRKLRRMGALYCIEVDPSTHQWQESWRKPSGSFLQVIRGKQRGTAPILQENVWTHRSSGKPLVLVDGDVAVSVDVKEQQLVWPTGYRIRQVLNSNIPRKFDEENSIPWGVIAVAGLIGLLACVGMLLYVISHLQHSGAA